MIQYLPKNRQFNIYADLYFGSAEAASALDELGHRFTLSCRKDRPSALFSRFLHTQDTPPNTCSVLYRRSPLTMRAMAAIKFWHQKGDGGEKIVNFISNTFVGKHTVQRRKETIVDVAHNYNTHMGYVDQLDAACQQFAYPHKLVNWKHAIFFWLIEATIHNCSIIWNHLHQSKEKFGVFRWELANELRQKGMGLTQSGHGLVSMGKKKKKCVVCRRRGILSSTTLCCPPCGNRPLHQSCYRVLHQPRLTSKGRRRKSTTEEQHEELEMSSDVNATTSYIFSSDDESYLSDDTEDEWSDDGEIQSDSDDDCGQNENDFITDDDILLEWMIKPTAGNESQLESSKEMKENTGQ